MTPETSAPLPRLMDRHLIFPPGSGGLRGQELSDAKLIATRMAQDTEMGRVGPGDLVPELRRSTVSWIDLSADTSWLFSRMFSLAHAANMAAGWEFDLVGPHKRIQASEYNEVDLGFYDWHLDLGSNRASTRKISVVIELAGADSGGVLQFRPGPNPWSIAVEPGTAIVFPSYLPHRLTPVTTGRRTSLASWVCGPRFR